MTTIAPPTPRIRTLIGVLIAITAVNTLAMSVVIPALPSIGDGLSADVAGVQFILSSYLVALATGHLFVGVLADRFGRRPVLLFGTLLFMIASLLAAFAPSLGLLIAARVVQGLGGSVGMVISRAVVRDLFDRERAASVIGYLTMALAVGPMVGPFLGGVLDDHLGWRSIFLSIAGVAFFATIIATAVMPETGTRQGTSMRALTRDIGELLTLPAFWAFALVVAAVTGTYFAFLGGAPFIAIDIFGLTSTEFGAYLLFASAGYSIGNFLAGRFSQRLGIHRMINIGNAMVLATLVVVGTFAVTGLLTPTTLFLPVIFLGLGNGFAMPNAIAGAISVRPEIAGTSSGLAGSVQFGVAAVATTIVGFALTLVPIPFTVVVTMAVFAVGATFAGMWSGSARA